MPFFKLVFTLLTCTALVAGADDAAEEGKEDVEVPIPLGIPMNGVKIPYFNEVGEEVMLLESDVATKIDEQTIEFENLKIEALDDEGRKIFVELPKSVFNLESRILSGDQSAKIHREDFEINGDSIEFDTRTKFGRLRGEISMVISSLNNDK